MFYRSKRGNSTSNEISESTDLYTFSMNKLSQGQGSKYTYKLLDNIKTTQQKSNWNHVVAVDNHERSTNVMCYFVPIRNIT